MPYAVEMSPRAVRQLRALPDDLQDRVLTRLLRLESDPRPSLAAPLRSESTLYRLRLGEVRLLYRVHDDLQLVRVLRISHRMDLAR